MKTTGRAPTFADALEAMAVSEMQETCNTTGTVDAISMAVEALVAHLDAETRGLWWQELKHCLDRRQAVEDGNGAWHDEGIDWDERVAEALGVLSGEIPAGR